MDKPTREPANYLGRSSIEAYGFVIVGIIIGIAPMTNTLRGVLIAIAAGLLIDIAWRSKASLSLRVHYKAILTALVLISAVGTYFLVRQPLESKTNVRRSDDHAVAHSDGNQNQPEQSKPNDAKPVSSPVTTPSKNATVKVITDHPKANGGTAAGAVGSIGTINAPCGVFQVGGVGNQATGGNCGPPPLELSTSENVVASDKGGLIKTIFTVVPNVPIPAPFDVVIDFDLSVDSIGFWVQGAGSVFGGGPSSISRGMHVVVPIGTGVSPQHALLLTVYSAAPVKIVKGPIIQ